MLRATCRTEGGVVIKFKGPLIPGVFHKRLHRFGALVEIEGRERYVHIPNSGRLRELLVEGARVLLRPGPAPDGPGVDGGAAVPGGSTVPTRKTSHTLILVRHGDHWVSIDSGMPRGLRLEAWRNRVLEGFAGYEAFRPEVFYGQSRLDFLLTGPDVPPCWVEAKSVTLVVDGEARFPDAPTDRGARHLRELAAARAEGLRAAVIFVIQREDAVAFAPNDGTDATFGDELRRSAAVGVEVHAVACRVHERGIEITPKELSVRI